MQLPNLTSTRNRPNHEGRTRGEVRPDAPSVEHLIRFTHAVLARTGRRTLGPAKVSKLCREYVNFVHGTNVTFPRYLANALGRADGEELDRAYRNFTADPTGDTAARNVDRERRAGHA